MSLYIVARRPGEIPRLLRLRAFSTDIGLDERGDLCAGSPATPLFSVHRSGDSYLLHSVAAGVRVGSKAIDRGGTIPLNRESEIQVGTFVMTTRITSSTHESAAISRQESPERPLWWAEIRIAGLQQRFPLFDGEFSAGSSDEDSLFVPIAGIMPRHLVCSVSPGEIQITGEGGRISIRGTPVNGTVCARTVEVITLMPCGVEVSFIPAAN